EHEHHHHHDGRCGCGCEDDDDDDCCGHEHHSHEEHHHEPVIHSGGVVRKVYRVTGLDCANCAAKMERQINELPEVEEATLTFATEQLRVWAKDPDALVPQMQAICAKIEPEAKLEPMSRKKAAESEEEEENILPKIISGAVLFVAGKLLEVFLSPALGLSISPIALAVYIIGYLLLGFDVLKTAVIHLAHGQVFDENFLMSIATLGAFGIGEYPEAAGVMLFYQIGEYFEDRAVERSRSNIMEAMDLRPEVIQLVQSDGSTITLPAEEAQVGDLVQVRPGDRIPLDGAVVEGESQIDTSPVTGEPVPVSVRPGNCVLSGCVNATGLLTMQVEQPLETSMVTRILESVENAAASKPQIDRFITRFSRIYTPIVVALALLVAIVPSIVTGNIQYWVRTACTFLVISCPCALVLSVPLAFYAGIGAASKQNILFKGGSAMETIAKVKAVVMDKTGTVTQGNFKLQQVLPADGVDEKELLALAAGCEIGSTHPIARSILIAAEEQQVSPARFEHVVEHAGRGIEADGVLCGNRKLMEEFGVSLPDIVPAMGAQVLVAKDGSYLGQLMISDTIKSGAKQAVSQMKAQGIRTAMLTGDSQESAEAVANAIGIDEVKSKLLPQDKVSALQEIRAQNGAVLFVGDGINDAPVLAGADVGAAMGSGADAAIEAADVVFLTGELSAVSQSISIGRQAVAVARQNVIFALAVKLLVILLGLFGYANMWAAVFADTGVAMLCILNSIRILYRKAR
ncbi:MAG: heavy metal translocating P-type ATPase, partial [Oscillospiraceae bacterium]|nr:heavy metal translocating P-type ATPase [Oscillospiraceae bacterium]